MWAQVREINLPERMRWTWWHKPTHDSTAKCCSTSSEAFLEPYQLTKWAKMACLVSQASQPGLLRPLCGPAALPHGSLIQTQNYEGSLQLAWCYLMAFEVCQAECRPCTVSGQQSLLSSTDPPAPSSWTTAIHVSLLFWAVCPTRSTHFDKTNNSTMPGLNKVVILLFGNLCDLPSSDLKLPVQFRD